MRKEYDFTGGKRGAFVKNKKVLVRKGRKDPQFYEIILEVYGDFLAVKNFIIPNYDRTRLSENYLIGPTTQDAITAQAEQLLELFIRKAAVLSEKQPYDPSLYQKPAFVVRAASNRVLEEHGLFQSMETT